MIDTPKRASRRKWARGAVWAAAALAVGGYAVSHHPSSAPSEFVITNTGETQAPVSATMPMIRPIQDKVVDPLVSEPQGADLFLKSVAVKRRPQFTFKRITRIHLASHPKGEHVTSAGEACKQGVPFACYFAIGDAIVAPIALANKIHDDFGGQAPHPQTHHRLSAGAAPIPASPRQQPSP